MQRHVEVLDSRDDVVLVHSLVEIIDSAGKIVSVYDSQLTESESEHPHERFRALTHPSIETKRSRDAIGMENVVHDRQVIE